MSEAYDSSADTNKHISLVRDCISQVRENLDDRAWVHDRSKLEDPEKNAFDVATPKLKGLVYGSEQYKKALRSISPALKHHYSVNDHHPEHYSTGIKGMSLMALMEMLSDWKAAGQRHDPPTPFEKSITYNCVRFEIPEYLGEILRNTARELKWD